MGGGEFTKDTTTVFKGVAILMIVMGHVGQLVPFSRPFTPLGAIGVAIALIYINLSKMGGNGGGSNGGGSNGGDPVGDILNEY